MSRSDSSDEAYKRFLAHPGQAWAQHRCLSAVVSILQARDGGDPRVTEPEIQEALHDVSRSIGRRCRDLARRGYLKEAGRKYSSLQGGLGRNLCNAWTTPDRWKKLPAEHQVEHPGTGRTTLAPLEALVRFTGEVLAVMHEASEVVETSTSDGAGVAVTEIRDTLLETLRGLVENLRYSASRASSRQKD
jgi:hypothetical protein